jgi:hypothetical protein
MRKDQEWVALYIYFHIRLCFVHWDKVRLPFTLLQDVSCRNFDLITGVLQFFMDVMQYEWRTSSCCLLNPCGRSFWSHWTEASNAIGHIADATELSTVGAVSVKREVNYSLIRLPESDYEESNASKIQAATTKFPRSNQIKYSDSIRPCGLLECDVVKSGRILQIFHCVVWRKIQASNLSRFLWKVDRFLPDCTMSQFIRRRSLQSYLVLETAARRLCACCLSTVACETGTCRWLSITTEALNSRRPSWDTCQALPNTARRMTLRISTVISPSVVEAVRYEVFTTIPASCTGKQTSTSRTDLLLPVAAFLIEGRE